MERIQSLETTRSDSKLQELPAVTQKAIEEVIGKYIEAGRVADSSIMKRVFHENAQMSGPAGDGAFSGPIQALYDFVDSHGPETDLDMQIVSITISDERAASVVLRPGPWHGKTLAELDLRNKHHVTIVAIRRRVASPTASGVESVSERVLDLPQPDSRLTGDDTLILAGFDKDINRLPR